MIPIVLIILILLFLLFLLIKNTKENIIPSDINNKDTQNMKKKKVYNTAYELGSNYLEIMNQHNFYDIEYPAVMFDIDDTLINYDNEPIKSVIKLLNKCIELKLIIVIITAREDKYYNHTIDDLRENGIRYNFLFLRKPSDDIHNFKSKIKEKLAEKDNIITIMSIGDNIIDIDGDYSGYFIKLPNKQDPNLYHLNSDKKLEIINV